MYFSISRAVKKSLLIEINVVELKKMCTKKIVTKQLEVASKRCVVCCWSHCRRHIVRWSTETECVSVCVFYLFNRSKTILKCIVENEVNSRSHIDDIYQHPFLLWHILIYTNYFGMFAIAYCVLCQTALFSLDLTIYLIHSVWARVSAPMSFTIRCCCDIIKLMTQFVIYFEMYFFLSVFIRLFVQLLDENL